MTSRPAQASLFTPRTRPVVPPIHHSVTYFLDEAAYKDVQAGGLTESGDLHWSSPLLPRRLRLPAVDRGRLGSGARRRCAGWQMQPIGDSSTTEHVRMYDVDS